MIQSIIKQPGEKLRLVPDAFRGREVVAVEGIGHITHDAVPLTLAASAELVNGALVVVLTGGVDGERVSVSVQGRCSDDAVVEVDLDVAVIESVWRLPDGGAPYLSISAFVCRFGLDEVVRMTDADGSGRIDRSLLIGALTDAQAEVEAHLASRYSLPLASVPRIVEMAIADRARARLYPRGAPDGVDASAKNALRMLERIQSGDLTLGVPAADAPAAPASSTPIIIAPGRRQYPDGLADY